MRRSALDGVPGTGREYASRVLCAYRHVEDRPKRLAVTSLS